LLTSSLLSDPKIGQAAGFGGVILHGLSTFGFAARAIIKVVAENDPTALKFFGVRFTAPVKPGDTLETQMWEVGPGPAGTTEVTFITKNVNSGKVSYPFALFICTSLKFHFVDCLGWWHRVHPEARAGKAVILPRIHNGIKSNS
jgi:hypothetical protein